MKKIKMTKNSIKIFIVTMFLCFCFPVAVFADGNVSYVNHAEGFVFEPGSNASPTDLFPSFDEIVPGDSLSETIVINNNSAEKKKAKIYLRALGADTGSDEFLSQMNLSVTQASTSNEIFNATANEKAGLSDWVLLGTFSPGSSETLDVTLTVPITMGDDFQDAIGILNWEFKVEEIEPEETTENTAETTDDNTTEDKSTEDKSTEDKTTTSKTTTTTGNVKKTSPKTGDENDAIVMFILALGAAATIFISLRRTCKLR